MSRSLALSILVGASLTSGFRKTFGAATRQSEQLGAAMTKTQRDASRLGAYRKLGGSVMAMGKDHRAAKAELASVAAEIRKTKQPTAEMSARFEAARAKVEQSGRAYQRGRRRLADLRAEMERAGQSTKNLAGQQQRLNREYEALAKQRARIQQVDAARTANLDRRAGLRGQLIDAGAMAAGLFAAIRPAAMFEDRMEGVGAIANATQEDLDRLAEAARRNRLKMFSASQTADAQGFLAMAGFSADEIIAAQLDVQKLALAGRTDLARASDIASDILSGFGREASELGSVADVLAKTFTSSNTNLEMLGDTMKYVGPLARSTGTPIETVAAMTGLLANVGIKASQAGTSLRATFSRLSAPAGDAADVLADLGVETRDLEGNLLAIPEILKDLSRATEDLGTGERAEVLKKIFGDEPAAAVAELMSQAASGGLDAYIATINASSGTVDQIAERMGKRTTASLATLSSAFESIAISTGTLLLPALSSGALAIADVVEAGAGIAERFPVITQVIVGATAGLIGLKVASIAGAYAWTFLVGGALTLKRGLIGLQTLYTLLTGRTVAYSAVTLIARARTLALGAAMLLTASAGKAGMLVSAFTGAGGVLASFAKTAIPLVLMGLRSVGLAMVAATGPIGWAIAAVAAGAGLLIAYWDDVEAFFTGLFDSLGVDFGSFWGTLKTLFSWSPIGLVARAWAGLAEAAMGPLQELMDMAGGAMGWISSLFGGDGSTDAPSISASLGANDNAPQSTSIAERIAGNDNALSRGNALSAFDGSAARRLDPSPANNPSPATVNQTITITINAAPGQDPEEIARQVQRVLDRERRGALHDG